MQITLKIKDENDAFFYFSNFSVTNAAIFLKFYTQPHKILINYQKKFRKDLCTQMRAQGKNARACAHMHLRLMRTCAFAWCARVCPQIFMKFFGVVHCFLMSLGVKFHKDWSVHYGEI